MALKLDRIEADVTVVAGLDVANSPALAFPSASDRNPDTRPVAHSPGADRARATEKKDAAPRRATAVAAGTLPPALFHLSRDATPETLRLAAEAIRREAELLDFRADEIEREQRQAEARRQRRIAFTEALDAMRRAVADEAIPAEIAVLTIAAEWSIDPKALLTAHRADMRKSSRSERGRRDLAIWRLYCRAYSDQEIAERANLSPSRVREVIAAQRKIHQR